MGGGVAEERARYPYAVPFAVTHKGRTWVDITQPQTALYQRIFVTLVACPIPVASDDCLGCAPPGAKYADWQPFAGCVVPVRLVYCRLETKFTGADQRHVPWGHEGAAGLLDGAGLLSWISDGYTSVLLCRVFAVQQTDIL